MVGFWEGNHWEEESHQEEGFPEQNWEEGELQENQEEGGSQETPYHNQEGYSSRLRALMLVNSIDVQVHISNLVGLCYHSAYPQHSLHHRKQAGWHDVNLGQAKLINTLTNCTSV